MAKKQEDAPAGAPAWVMTFADLMSLLMCFFVLLLSFSEMDAAKYKEVAGSMKMAFGIQRDVKVTQSPKGVSIVAKEYTPGKPQPTIEKVLRQQTTDENRQYLEILKAGGLDELLKAKEESDRRKFEQEHKAKMAKKGLAEDGSKLPGKGKGGSAGEGEGEGKGEGENGSGSGSGNKGTREGEGQGGNGQSGQQSAESDGASMAQAARIQASMLSIALEDEVDEGLVEVEAVKDGVLIRVREKGSFPSGTADMSKKFLPVLDKIAGALVTTQSKLVVSGHTDNRPISTARYPSNWALSAARATSVVQAFAESGKVAEERMEVRALADTDPLESNVYASGRASNRRVEIFIGTPPEPIDAAQSSAVDLPDEPADTAADNNDQSLDANNADASPRVTGERSPGLSLNDAPQKVSSTKAIQEPLS